MRLTRGTSVKPTRERASQVERERAPQVERDMLCERCFRSRERTLHRAWESSEYKEQFWLRRDTCNVGVASTHE